MNPRNQVEIKIHKNDYLTISFIGDINFAGRWYGTPETLREKLRSFPHKSERDKVLEDLEKDMHEHYDFVAAQYNIQGGAYYRGRKELYEQIFEKLVELQCSKREGQG